MTQDKLSTLERKCHRQLSGIIFSLGHAVKEGNADRIKNVVHEYLKLEIDASKFIDILPYRITVECGLHDCTFDAARYLINLEWDINEKES